MRAVLELEAVRIMPSPATGEAALVSGLRAGDVSAFERLYREQGPRMKSVAWNMVGSATDAEDAVQESFLKAYRSMNTFTGQSTLTHWMFRILVNTCYDILRQRRRRQEVDSDAEIRVEPGHTGLRVALERALKRLSLRHRTVFVLFEVEGYRHNEIAEILDVPEGTSRSLLFEAKRELRLLLAPAGGAQ